MGTHLEGSPDHQSIRHMLVDSPWDYKRLLKDVEEACIQLFAKTKQPIYLLLDEVGFRKKGNHSACVSHQYLGSIGKSDNGQVAVVVALCSAGLYVPIDLQLYMPNVWALDDERRELAGIPSDIAYQTKVEIGLAIIQRVVKEYQVNVSFCVFDALYGSSTAFLGSLMAQQTPFIAEIRERQTIYLHEPNWVLPTPTSHRGRKPTLLQPDKEGISIKEYSLSLRKRKDFKRIAIRQGTKGMIKALCHRKKVWVLNEETKEFMALHLLIRINKDKSIKYALGYSPHRCTMRTMMVAQAQRVFIERVFEEGKNIVGMGDYQVRSWMGFHKHMALCALALLYIAIQKANGREYKIEITAYLIYELIVDVIQTVNVIEALERRYNPPNTSNIAKCRKKG